jgi:hypothetical protein
LFKNDLKLYIYPLLDQSTGALTTVQNLQVSPDLRKLYEHLVDRGCILQLEASDPKHLNTFSREVLKQIQSGDMDWINHVPGEVADLIQQRRLFGLVKQTKSTDTKPLAIPVGTFPLLNTTGMNASVS